MILAHLSQFAANPAALGFWFQDQAAPTVGFSPLELAHNMGPVALGVVGVLFIMSIWSLAVIIDRYLYFAAARKQSRDFAPRVAGALRENKLDEAIKVADRNKKRALERSEAIVHAKLKRGLGGLATIGSTAPFVGLFGTVAGILKAFQEIAVQKTPGIGAVAGGISEALVTTAFGLLVAIPAVMTFNYFTNKVEAFDVEMDNSASELVDYFLKQNRR